MLWMVIVNWEGVYWINCKSQKRNMEKYPFNCAHIFTCVSSLNYSQLFVFIAPVQLDKRCIHTDHIQWVETRVRVRDPRLFSPQFTISLFGYWTQYSLARVSNAEFPLKNTMNSIHAGNEHRDMIPVPQ